MAKKTKKVTKAAFVRSLPESVPAKDVVAKAKGAGLKISEKHVYVIRSEARKAKKPKASIARAGNDERTFRTMVMALGIPKCRAIVDDVERRLSDLIEGR